MLVLKNALTLSVYLKSHYYVLMTTYIPSTLTREALVRQYHYQSSYPACYFRYGLFKHGEADEEAVKKISSYARQESHLMTESSA